MCVERLAHAISCIAVVFLWASIEFYPGTLNTDQCLRTGLGRSRANDGHRYVSPVGGDGSSGLGHGIPQVTTMLVQHRGLPYESASLKGTDNYKPCGEPDKLAIYVQLIICFGLGVPTYFYGVRLYLNRRLVFSWLIQLAGGLFIFFGWNVIGFGCWAAIWRLLWL
jgi:hypothetical protein